MESVVVYARVSTKEQAEEGYSISAQLKAIREHCAREGYEIVAEFVESESAGRAGRKRFAAYFDEHALIHDSFRLSDFQLFITADCRRFAY